MNFFTSPEDIILMTPDWHGERFADGRPRVSDDLLRRVKNLTTEEAWLPMWGKFKYQFEGGFKRANEDPNYVMVGRAVTVQMVPSRPDVNKALLDEGHRQGQHGFFNQWTIQCLTEGDVLVVDMFDKVEWGTYVGGNLSTSIKNKTKTGGAVVWGGIRDLQQIKKIKDYQVYYRDLDPTPIGLDDVMLGGINRPTKIGKAICMPGDVVLATCSGVLFIPPQMVEPACIAGEKAKCKDVFGFARLKEGKYTSAQVDANIWAECIMDDFREWLKTSPDAEPYKHLDWSEEIEKSKGVKLEDFTGVS